MIGYMTMTKHTRFILHLLTIVFVMFCTSCLKEVQHNSQGSTVLQTISPPMGGHSTVYGKAISKSENYPLVGVSIWLAKIFEEQEEFFILDTLNSPNTMTDTDGFFLLENVSPGKYVVVVGDPEIYYEIITDESGKAKVWIFPSNELIDLGILRVSVKR